MHFGSAIGTACLTFLITNIDDAFVLVTFFAESSTSRTLTPFKITLGQYIGFTLIVAISLIGFGVAVVVPAEPIGFLGLLPILLGVWKFFGLLFPRKEENEEEQPVSSRDTVKSILKVASITIMNGGDNIGVYVPLFSQAKGAEIAIYVVVFYILLGVWCLVAFLVMKQKHILRVAQKYAEYIVPFLYLGLGIYIVVKSDCYPWSIHEIDDQFLGNPGKLVMGVVTGVLLSSLMGLMVWVKMKRRLAASAQNDRTSLTEITPAAIQDTEHDQLETADSKSKPVTRAATEHPGDDIERASAK